MMKSINILLNITKEETNEQIKTIIIDHTDTVSDKYCCTIPS